MVHWIGAQSRLKWFKIQKHAFFVTSPRETPTQIKYFLKIETDRLVESVDGLNSSVAMVAGKL